ncbi:MAG: hypothetical protein ABIA97_04050 [Candidatus Omnitrophota bacterium]
MIYLRNLISLIRDNRGMSIVILFVCVIAIGLVTTAIYHLTEGPKTSAGVPKGLDELIGQLDRAIDSVKAKTTLEALNFEITKEAEAEDNTKMLLSGILWSGKSSLAIINKKIVGLGDRVADCWVSAIEEDSVTLRCREEGEKTIRCSY